MIVHVPQHALPTFARLVTSAAFLIGLCGCVSVPPEDARMASERNQTVIASPVRTDQDRRMDAARRPAELLTFTEVRPGMQVLDIAAGGGYTAQLLALAVAPGGKVWAQSPQPGATITKRLADQPQANFVLVKRPFDDPVPEDAPKFDLVTIVLNYHDISYLPVDRAKMNQRLFAALKPGGRLVVIDHSAQAGTGITAGRTLHRIDEALVQAEFLQAGYVLDAQGNFLRNAADTRTESSNEPKVPTDKFVLRFAKPRAS